MVEGTNAIPVFFMRRRGGWLRGETAEYISHRFHRLNTAQITQIVLNIRTVSTGAETGS